MKRIPAVFAILLLAAPAVQATELDTSLFAKKSDITVSGYSGSTTLANFPVLVRLSVDSPDGFNYADCAADGADLRFADENGDLIPHEIDTWNASGESLVWVRVPSISGTETPFTMYYGAADVSALPAVAAADVWTNANYNVVWHFSGDARESANGLADSGSSGTPDYTASTFGVGTCFKASANATLGYNADSRWTTLGPGNTLTVSTWAKYDHGSPNYARMLSCMSNWEKPAGWELTIQNASVDQITVGSSGRSQYYYTASGVGPGSGNVHLTVVYNADQTVELYTNGVLATAQTLNPLATPTEKFWIGSLNGNGNKWYGSLDEIRIHRDAESADWVKACYDTMASDSFLTMADVDSPSGVMPLSIRLKGVTRAGTTATIAGRLSNLGDGATSAAVTLYYARTKDVEGGTRVGPTNLTGKADIVNTIAGLVPAKTYYYAYRAVNDLSETAWSSTNSFVVEAATQFSDTIGLAVRNCRVTATGTMTVWGVGSTKVELLVGASPTDLVAVQTNALEWAPANMRVVFAPFVRNPGTWYVAIRATTTYRGEEWVCETAPAPVTLSDDSAYTWKGGAGSWTDPSMWTSTGEGAAGFPSDGCTVVFPAADSAVVLSANVALAGLTVSSEGTHVFRSRKASSTYTLKSTASPAVLAGAGGGTVVFDNIVVDGKLADLAGLRRLAIVGRGRVFPANGATTDILLVDGGCLYSDGENGKTFGRLVLRGGPGRIASPNGGCSFSFASLETRPGSGVSAVLVNDGKVAIRDRSSVEMVGGTDTFENPGPRIPVCPQFAIAAGNQSDPSIRFCNSLCTIDAGGVVRRIPQSTMLDSFENATELDNVCITNFASLASDVTVNAVVFSGAGCNLGGHRVTVKSGQFREGTSGLFNKVVSNGVARLCRPNVVADTTNNSDIRMQVDFETEGGDDMLAPMLAHEATTTGWAYRSGYAGFTGVFSTPREREYYLQNGFSSPKAVVELRASKLTSMGHWAKANYGGLAGDGEVNFRWNGAVKWHCNVWLGEMSDDDKALVADGTVDASVVVGDKGVIAPGLVGFDGGRRGTIRMAYNAQGDIPILRAFEMREGGTFQTSVNSDGTCGCLDLSETEIAGTYLSVSLAGSIAVAEGGKAPIGLRLPVIKYHKGTRTGKFSRRTSCFKVEYDVPQPDGSHAVTVTRLPTATLLILR